MNKHLQEKVEKLVAQYKMINRVIMPNLVSAIKSSQNPDNLAKMYLSHYVDGLQKGIGEASKLAEKVGCEELDQELEKLNEWVKQLDTLKKEIESTT